MTIFLKWLVIFHAAAALLSLLLYGYDKLCARLNLPRVPETTLLWIDMLGGWPGGVIGQNVWRHKRAKTAYQVRFRRAVALHVTLLIGILLAAWRLRGESSQ